LVRQDSFSDPGEMVQSSPRLPVRGLQSAIVPGSIQIRDLFRQAREARPALVFVDEIDAIAARRGEAEDGAGLGHNSALNQLLVELDGFQTTEGCWSSEPPTATTCWTRPSQPAAGSASTWRFPPRTARAGSGYFSCIRSRCPWSRRRPGAAGRPDPGPDRGASSRSAAPPG
jgi:SpoVK/Ycf46/Vps4 family AAA+-type ATPase